MSTTDKRADTAEPSARSGAQWLLGLFIALAIVASILMVVFGRDLTWTATLAVIAALWAAVIGAVLMSRYRRQAEVAEKRGRDLRLVYELQLEREIAARRQYETEVEQQIRAEVRDEQNEEFEALKAQVLALRASLEKVLGNPLPEVPLALRPERRRELGSGLSGVGYARSADDRVAAALDFASTAAPSDSGRHIPTGAGSVAESAETELTEIIPVVTDEPVDYATAGYDESPAVDYPAADYEATPAESGVYETTSYQAEYQSTAYGQDVDGQPEYVEYRQSVEYQQTVEYSGEYAGDEYAEAAEAVEETPDADYDTGEISIEAEYGQSIDPVGYEATAYDAEEYEPPVLPDVIIQDETDPAYAESEYGESAVGSEPDDEAPARSRRAADDEDGAHAAGRPASELLSQLRAAAGNGQPSGGRRRRD